MQNIKKEREEEAERVKLRDLQGLERVHTCVKKTRERERKGIFEQEK